MTIRSIHRLLMAGAIVVAPVFVGLALLLGPFTGDPPSGLALLDRLAAVRGTAELGDWFGFLGALLMLAATLGVVRLARRGAPVLSLIGGALTLAGYASVLGLIAIDAAGYEMLAFSDRSTMGALLDHINNDSALYGVMTLVFVVGHLLGSVVLGLALIRARVVPLWTGILFTIGLPIHLAAHLSGGRAIDLAGAVVQTVAAAVIAARVVRTADDDWDLAPIPRGAAAARREEALAAR